VFFGSYLRDTLVQKDSVKIFRMCEVLLLSNNFVFYDSTKLHVASSGNVLSGPTTDNIMLMIFLFQLVFELC